MKVDKQLFNEKIAEINANLDTFVKSYKDKTSTSKKPNTGVNLYEKISKLKDNEEDFKTLHNFKARFSAIVSMLMKTNLQQKVFEKFPEIIKIYEGIDNLIEDIRFNKEQQRYKLVKSKVKGNENQIKNLEAELKELHDLDQKFIHNFENLDLIMNQLTDRVDDIEARLERIENGNGNQAGVNTNGEPPQTTNTDEEPGTELPGDTNKKNKKWKVIKAIILGSVVAAAAGGIGFGIGKAMNSQSKEPQPEPPQPVNVVVNVDVSSPTNIQNNYFQGGKPAEDGAKPPVEEPTNNPPPQGPETITPPKTTTPPQSATPKQDVFEEAAQTLNDKINIYHSGENNKTYVEAELAAEAWNNVLKKM